MKILASADASCAGRACAWYPDRTLRSRPSKRAASPAFRILCVLVVLAASLSAQIEGRARLLQNLEAKRFEASGTALALLERERIPPGNAAMQSIRQLSLEDLRRVRAAHARMSRTDSKLARLLDAQIARLGRQDVRAIELLLPVIEDRVFGAEASDGLGRAGLRLCRRGDAAGLRGLRAVQKRWPGAGWALGNLALGLRLLGRYDEAAVCYEDLLIATRRAPWALNDAALVEVARGRIDRALELLFEGVRAGGDGAANCGGNAAVLLMRRGRRGDAIQAEALLERIVARDKTRTRARFWLERLRRRRLRAQDAGSSGSRS